MPTEPSQHSHTDHRPYIEAVRAALLLKDISVGDAAFNTGRVRSATMPLWAPDEDFDEPWHFTFTSAESVELHWTEEDGWSVLALHSDAGRLLPTIWRRGFGALLPLDEVAAWAALLLTMPIAVSSREDGPYRSHQQYDSAFEAALATFAR